MLDLNDLRLFVAIVEHQGILKAGRALRLPKSTISRRLAGLEAQLKARLVIRAGEEFALTPAGQEAYALGLQVVEAARRAEDRLLPSARAIGGQVGIAASSLFLPVLPGWLAELGAAHPGLSFSLEISERDPEPAGGGAELYLRAHDGALRDSALIQRRICRTPLVLVAAPGVPVPDHPAAFADDLLVFGGDPGRREWAMTGAGQGASETRLGGNLRLISCNLPLLLAAAEAGQGAALIPEFAARAGLAAGRLVAVLPGWLGPSVAVTLLSPPREGMNATLRLCADTLAARAKAAVLAPAPDTPADVGGVQDRERAVPELRPGLVTDLSYGGARPGRRNDALMQPSPESEMPMTPFQTTLGSAALTAALALPAAAQDAQGPLVLYTNDFEGVITERFEADTGREIDVVQMSGGEILARIAAEAANPQWDVLIYNGSYTFHMLDQQEALLRGVEPANLANLNETGARFLPENRSWFPIGLSASCVMLYRTDLVDAPPTAYEDLADPRFNGQFGMADPAVAAPAYPCVAQFFESMGDEGARDLFTRYFENGMRVFRTNGPTGAALVSGDISLALITSQVAYTLMADGEVPVDVVWPAEGAPGVVRGAAIQARTARPEAAQAFVEWLLEPATQSWLAESAPSDGKFEPTVTGATRRADGPPAGQTYLVASDDFAVEHEAEIKTWFADQALN